MNMAVAGLGGFARAHHQALARLESEGLCRVVATCDPALDLPAELAARGVKLYRSLEELLARHAGELDVLTLPVPIPLHAAMHRMAVDAGVACYLEKPPTLYRPEYLEMLEVERRARKSTQVGFNFVSDPMRQRLKARILAGEFGRLLGATFLGIWPRDRTYYQRAPWAGRAQVDGQFVLDNPIGNAMAHYVQNALFWCGQGSVESVAEVVSVRARLERYRPIEMFDTVMLEAELAGGAWLRIAATHAATGAHVNEERVILERATISLDSSHTATVRWADGRVETLPAVWPDTQDSLVANLRRYLAYVHGEVERPTTLLTDCRGFVSLIHLAILSSTIEDYAEGDPEWVSAPGMEERLRRSLSEPKLPAFDLGTDGMPNEGRESPTWN